MAFLNKGLEIVVRDRRRQADEIAEAVQDITAEPVDAQDEPHAGAGGGLEQSFRFDRGLVDYVEHLNRQRNPAHPSVISFEADAAPDSASGLSLEVAMQWNTGYTESGPTFAHTIHTHEIGTGSGR